jgi:DASS family divalent anion:Na+ symporter
MGPFSVLPQGSQARLIALFSIEQIEKDKAIIKSSEEADYIFFLIDGSINLTIQKQIISLKEGMFFGEECVLDQKSYVGTAIATSKKVTIAKIHKYDLIRLVKYDRKMLNELILNFSREFTKKFQQKTEKGIRKKKTPLYFNEGIYLLGWLSAIITPIFLFYSLDVYYDFQIKQKLFICILSGTLITWAFRLVPEFIPSIFALLISLGIGLTDPKVILSGFSSRTFIMALGIFGIAAIVMSSGLLYRILLNLLNKVPKNNILVNMSMFTLGAALTPTIPDTTNRINLSVSFIKDAYATLRLHYKDKMWTVVVANALQSVTLLGPIFLSSSVRNYVLLGLFWGQYQTQFQWIGWLKASIVTAAILIGLHGIAMAILMRGFTKINLSRTLITKQIETLGSPSSYEWAAGIGTFICFLGMATTRYHRINPETIALLVMSTLLTFSFIRRTGFNNDINWTELVYLAGLTGLLSTANHIGLLDMVSERLSFIGNYALANFNMAIAIIFIAVTLTRFIMPKGPTIFVFGSILIPIAQSIGVSPWLMAFMILVFGESFYFPFQSPEYTSFQFDLMKHHPFNKGAVLILNAVLNLLKLAAIYLSLPYWKAIGLLSL